MRYATTEYEEPPLQKPGPQTRDCSLMITVSRDVDNVYERRSWHLYISERVLRFRPADRSFVGVHFVRLALSVTRGGFEAVEF